MKELIKYFKKHGYARMKELKEQSFHTGDISRLLKEGIIFKVKPGLYRINEFQKGVDVKESYLDICQAVPEGVLYLISALDFHNLTTFNPMGIYIAIPHNKKAPKIFYPPVKFFYLYENFYNRGIEKIQTKYGNIRVYDREKTLCDMFRYRNKLGEDLAIEGLKNYLNSSDANIEKLINYAEIYKAKTILMPYLKTALEYKWE